MNGSPDDPSCEEMDPNESCDRAWFYYQHADNLLAGRSNFFLVAEAMLIAGYMAVSGEETLLRLPLAILAIVYTACWFYVNKRLLRRMRSLIADLKRDPIYTRYLESVSGPSAGVVLNQILPLATLGFWLVLAVLYALKHV